MAKKKRTTTFESAEALREAVEAPTDEGAWVSKGANARRIEEDPRSGFECRHCGGRDTYVVRTRRRAEGFSRYRACRDCKHCFWTIESAV